ncbi:MAG: phosphoribosyltransferase [Elusimicrobia bacterium]|nr:phosphoribosyltransferase [Elusimicrobiota bacterium]
MYLESIDAIKYVFDSSDIAEFCAFTKGFRTDEKCLQDYALRLVGIIKADKDFLKNIDFFTYVGNYQNAKTNYSLKLAESISSATNIPLKNIIEKTSPSKEVKFLPPQTRKQEIENTFNITQNIKGAKICIIDDVLATGATISTVAGLLKNVGAQKVYAGIVCLNNAF